MKQQTDYRKVIEQKRQEMTNALLQCITDNPKQWEKGWQTVNEFPYNGKTQQKYKGANAILLWLTGAVKGFNDPRWVTFNQATELGASVKKGEKSSTVFYWRLYDKKTKKDFDERTVANMTKDEAFEYKKENVVPVIKTYAVFNANQCENFPERPKAPEMTQEERQKQNVLIEQVIANSEAPVLYDGGGQAYYSLKDDKIHLPKIADFKSMQDYYATALHEIAHSTGHETRLDRHLQTANKEEYAKEELRAELASVFMQDELGLQISGQHFENHGAYLASWLQAVKEDANEFFKAAKDAELISDYVAEHYAKQQKTVVEDNDKEEPAALTKGKNKKITFVFTSNYDDSQPNNNYGEEKDFFIFEDGYTLEDYFSDNSISYEKSNVEGEYIILSDYTVNDERERTGERYHVLSIEDTDEKVNVGNVLAPTTDVTSGPETIQLKMTTEESKIFQDFIDAYTNDVNLERKQIVDFGANRPKSSDFWYGLTFLGNVEQSGLSYSVDFDRTKERAKFSIVDNDNEVENDNAAKQSIVPAETQTKYNTKEFISTMNNSVTLQGTLFDNVEIQTSSNGNKYATAAIEVERNYGDTTKTDVFPITLFGNAAEQICSFKKGANISIAGYLKNSTYQDTTTLSLIGGKVEPAEIGSKNNVVLSGFVNNKKLELKEAANGTKYLSLALSVKADYVPEGKEATYSTFFTSAFGKTADRMVANYHNRDLIQVTGSLNVSENGKLSVTAHRSELIRSAQEMSAGKDDDAHTADENTK